MDAFVKWLAVGAPVSELAGSGTRTRAESESGAPGRRAVALLRLTGLFDRPATADCLDALWKASAIAGLTEPPIGLTDSQWNIASKRLGEARLPTVNPDAVGTLLSLDAHPRLHEG